MTELELFYSTEYHEELLAKLIPEQAFVGAYEGENMDCFVVNTDKLSLENKANILNAYIEEINPDTGLTYTTQEFDMSLNEMFKFIDHRLESVYEEEEEDGDVIVISYQEEQERLYTILYYPYMDAQTDDYSYVRPPIRDLLQNGIFERVESTIVYLDTQQKEFVPVTEATSSVNPNEIILSETYYVN